MKITQILVILAVFISVAFATCPGCTAHVPAHTGNCSTLGQTACCTSLAVPNGPNCCFQTCVAIELVPSGPVNERAVPFSKQWTGCVSSNDLACLSSGYLAPSLQCAAITPN